MVFEISEKVILITGGSSGVGLQCAKELLRNGAKGITIADIDPALGQKAIKEITKEYDASKVIFVRTRVSNRNEFENAFKKTIEAFKHIDVLINNAGVAKDPVRQTEVETSMVGVIHGMILSMDHYLSKYKQNEEALIVNIASICRTHQHDHVPINCGTKSALIAVTKSWGIVHHYEKSKVRVIAVCPEGTLTDDIHYKSDMMPGEFFHDFLETYKSSIKESGYVARETIEVMKTGTNGSVWIMEEGKSAYEYIVPEQEVEKIDS